MITRRAALAIALTLGAWSAVSSLAPALSTAQEARTQTLDVSYRIRGMVCLGCADTVQEVIAALEGVRSVTVSLEEHRADVVWEGAARDQALVEAVREAGFRATRVREPASSG